MYNFLNLVGDADTAMVRLRTSAAKYIDREMTCMVQTMHGQSNTGKFSTNGHINAAMRNMAKNLVDYNYANHREVTNVIESRLLPLHGLSKAQIEYRDFVALRITHMLCNTTVTWEELFNYTTIWCLPGQWDLTTDQSPKFAQACFNEATQLLKVLESLSHSVDD